MVVAELAVANFGQSPDTSALDIESALSGGELGDCESFSAMEDAASSVAAVRSMKGEALARTVAAVLINFDDDLRSDWLILADCLQVLFRLGKIGGDMIVGYPEAELYQRIVDALRSDETYRSLGGSACSSFEWRLQQYLRGLRLA